MDNRHNNLVRQVERLALRAMLWELATTPKPGLVDRANRGAHRDLDFLVMMGSAMAIAPYIGACAGVGAELANEPLPALWPHLRSLGLAAEQAMRTVTAGSNAHKGQIFSLGLLASVYGREITRQPGVAPLAEELCGQVGILCRGLVKQDLAATPSMASATYGQRLYASSGVRGARGEAESGYVTVRRLSLPRLRMSVQQHGQLRNDHLVQALLALMGECEDTNLLGRGGPTALREVQEWARQVLILGGMETEQGRAAIIEFDQELICRYLSPGGSADLLAVTIFLLCLENPTLGASESDLKVNATVREKLLAPTSKL